MIAPLPFLRLTTPPLKSFGIIIKKSDIFSTVLLLPGQLHISLQIREIDVVEKRYGSKHSLFAFYHILYPRYLTA
jgi:hypothetical protein